MRARCLLLLPVLTAALAAPAGAATPPPAKRIAPGVTAGGIDVAGLTVLQAAQKLKAEATPALQAAEPVVLGVAGKPWTLTLDQAGLKVNGTRTARAAIKLTAPADVPLVTTHDPEAVERFVAGIAAKVGRSPRNATLRITLRKMVVRRARTGRGLDQPRARRLVTAALVPGAERTLHQRLTILRAPVNADDIRRQNSTVITIDKSSFRLRLFKNLKFSKSYGVATGQPAYPTPSGRFSIVNKQVNPTWSVPNSPWAGELQGTTVAGGTAANPLKARWMGIVNGIGIHGTGEESSIGTRASHGCLRMRVAEVIELYKRVPVGTPVLIA